MQVQETGGAATPLGRTHARWRRALGTPGAALRPTGPSAGTESALVPAHWLVGAPGRALPTTLPAGMSLGSGEPVAGAGYLSRACRV